LGLLVGLAAKPLGLRPWQASVVGVLLVSSHGLLDCLTDGGLGVALFWPFTTARYFFPWRPLPVAPIGRGIFSTRGLAVMTHELVFFLPLAAYAFWPRRRTRVAL
jgi:inner membrane protein